MTLTLTNSLIILLGLIITWCILFTILKEKSSLHLGIKLAALVVILSPFIAKYSYDLYATLSRQLFLMNANGEIQLSYSPFKMRLTTINYCDQFKDSKGKALHIFSIGEDDEGYCGEFWGLFDQKTVFLPFKLLDNHKAIYWASPDLQIVGPEPKHIALKNINNKENYSSKNPNRIDVRAGQSANVIVTKPFELPLDNQIKKTITAGTILSGFTLTPFLADEKSNQVQLKVAIDSLSCIALSDTKIRPDYNTATAIAKIISLNCSHNELNSLPIEAIASIPGRIIYSKAY